MSEKKEQQKGLDTLDAISNALQGYHDFKQINPLSGAATPEEKYKQDRKNEALNNTALLAAIAGASAKKMNKTATALAAFGFYPDIVNGTIQQLPFAGDISRLFGDNTEDTVKLQRYSTPGQSFLDLIDLGPQFHPASWMPAVAIDTAQAAFGLDENTTLNRLKHAYGDFSITQPLRSILDMDYNTTKGKIDKDFYQRKWEDYKQNMKVTPWYAKPLITGAALGDALFRSFYSDHLEDY